MNVNKSIMDADIQIMVGTVQTACQVCDKCQPEFLDTVYVIMAKFHRIVCGLSFHSAAFECGERGRASFGAGAGMDGRKFQLSRWSQGRIEQPNSVG